MSMITELVERLRELSMADMSFYKDEDYRKACKEAANTISVLSEKLHTANMERSTAYYNGGWIPVSERLPKIADVYRVTRHYPNNVMNPKYIVDACAFDGSNTWYNDNRINHERAYVDNIIAWQENPDPYKVEPQESEG